MLDLVKEFEYEDAPDRHLCSSSLWLSMLCFLVTMVHVPGQLYLYVCFPKVKLNTIYIHEP